MFKDVLSPQCNGVSDCFVDLAEPRHTISVRQVVNTISFQSLSPLWLRGHFHLFHLCLTTRSGPVSAQLHCRQPQGRLLPCTGLQCGNPDQWNPPWSSCVVHLLRVKKPPFVTAIVGFLFSSTMTQRDCNRHHRSSSFFVVVEVPCTPSFVLRRISGDLICSFASATNGEFVVRSATNRGA